MTANVGFPSKSRIFTLGSVISVELNNAESFFISKERYCIVELSSSELEIATKDATTIAKMMDRKNFTKINAELGNLILIFYTFSLEIKTSCRFIFSD